MILRFTVKDNHDFIAIDDNKPILQAEGGCRNMFGNAARHKGIFISDKKLDGWNLSWDYSGYFHGTVEGFGNLVSGAIQQNVLDAIGFNFRHGSTCWSAGDNCHKLNAAQAKKYNNMGTTEGKEYLAGLFPAEVVVKAAEPKKKGKAVRGADMALQV